MAINNTKADCSDYFCGAGGTGQGAEEAGLEMTIAANHWRLATETYETNFKKTKVYCADITASDPRYFPSTTFGLFSPECTTHSPAGGNTYAAFKKQMDLFEKGLIDPSAERSRMTMWDVVRFTEYHGYEIVVVENVVEAKTKWALFDTWLQAMHNLGYHHECLYINSMHCHPTPQSRDRMYVVFWKKGNAKPDLNFTPEAYCHHCEKIVNSYQWWKNPNKKWGKYGTNGQYLFRCATCTNTVEPFYHAAFNIIDWSIPGKSVLGRKKPLSKNTIRRIEYGLEKFGDYQLIIGHRYSEDINVNVKSLKYHPLPVQTSSNLHNVVIPFMVKGGFNREVKGMTEPTPGITTHNSHALVAPFMIKTDNATGKDAVAVRSTVNSFRTVTTTDPHGIVMPFVVVNNGKSKARSSVESVPSVTTEMKHGIINPESLSSFLSYYNGCNDKSAQASHITEPSGVVSTVDRIALVEHKKPTLEECTYRTIRPHEVHKAMAFREDYVILGNGKQQVKQLGNGVTPPAMKWIIERCLQSLS